MGLRFKLILSPHAVSRALAVIAALILCAGCRPSYEPSDEWKSFCSSDSHDIAKAHARRDNPVVAAAAATLSALPPEAELSVPGELQSLYSVKGAREGKFLDVLCSEYKDNSPQLAAKLRLLGRAGVVRAGVQRYDPALPLWPQLTAQGFRNLVLLARSLQEFRNETKPAAGQEPFLLSGCEARFIFKEYLANNAVILDHEDYAAYERALPEFLAAAAEKGECSAEEFESFFTFRGVGYVSPRDPESASLRQIGVALGGGCRSSRSPLRMFSRSSRLCDNFFATPYGVRRALAYQILRRLLMPKYSEFELLKNQNNPLFLTEDLDDDGVGEAIVPRLAAGKPVEELGKLARQINDFLRQRGARGAAPQEDPRKAVIKILDAVIGGEKSAEARYVTKSRWRGEFETEPDQGLGKLYQLSDPEGRKSFRKLLSMLLIRHAFFYRTLLYFKSFSRLFPATTPFLSTSAEVSQAFKFAVRGFAADRMKKAKLGWMYVFRVNKKDHYGAGDASRGETPDFETSWFDELSLSNHPYALEERGIDRFGEPAPQELEALLYLGEISVPSELQMLLKTKSLNQAASYKFTEGEFDD